MATRDEVIRKIRDAADQGLKARLDPIRDAIAKLERELEALGKSVQTTSRSLPASSDMLPEAQVAALIAELPAPTPPPAPAAAPAGAGFDWPAYKDAALAIDVGKTQIEILNAYLTGAAQFADRVALFVLKGDRVAGWKGSGFAAHGGIDDAVKTVGLVPAEDPEVERLFTQEKSIFLSADGDRHFFNRLPGQLPAMAALIPMAIKEKVAAFLYADEMPKGKGRTNFHALELLTLLTTRSIDQLAARKLIPNPSLTASAAMPSGPDADFDQTATRAARLPAPVAPVAPPAAAPIPPAPAKPPAPEPPPRLSIKIPAKQLTDADLMPKPATGASTTIAPAPVKVVPEIELPPPPKPATAPAATTFIPAPAKVPVPPPAPPPAAKPVEPPPAAKPAAEAKPSPLKDDDEDGAAPAKSTQFIPPAHLQKRQPGVIGGAVQAPPGMSPEEAKKHDEAKRFARLLVSEIKLYNESGINAGRKDGKIYEKLKDDIDRSRQMYDDRVPPDIKTKTNYFYDEMVRILADGKPELLGL